MSTIRVKNWDKFQHYKDRAPAWIKLHRDILDDFDFHSMPVASRALAPMLWLIASENERGEIDATPKRLAFRLRMTEKEVIDAVKPLIENGFFVVVDDASRLLADRLPREEEEREREKEVEKEKNFVEQQAARPPAERNTRADQAAAVFAHWQKVMGHSKAKLDAKRQRLIEARLKDGYTVEDLCNAITGCSLSPYHMGQNEQGTRYDGIDLICRDGGKVDKFLATYRNPPRATGRQGLIEARNQSAVEEFLSQPTKAQGDIIDMEVGHG